MVGNIGILVSLWHYHPKNISVQADIMMMMMMSYLISVLRN